MLDWNYCGTTDFITSVDDYTYHKNADPIEVTADASGATNQVLFSSTSGATAEPSSGVTTKTEKSTALRTNSFSATAGAAGSGKGSTRSNYSYSASASYDSAGTTDFYTQYLDYYTIGTYFQTNKTGPEASDTISSSSSGSFSLTGGDSSSVVIAFITTQANRIEADDLPTIIGQVPYYYDSKTTTTELSTNICSSRTIPISNTTGASSEFYTTNEPYTVDSTVYNTDSTLSIDRTEFGTVEGSVVYYDIDKAGFWRFGDCPTFLFDGRIGDKNVYGKKELTKTITQTSLFSPFGYVTSEGSGLYSSGYEIIGQILGFTFDWNNSGETFIPSDTSITSSFSQTSFTSSKKSEKRGVNPDSNTPIPTSQSGEGYAGLSITEITPVMPIGFLGFGNKLNANSLNAYAQTTLSTAGSSFSNAATFDISSVFSVKDIGAGAKLFVTGECGLPPNNSTRSLAWSTAETSPDFDTKSNLLATHASTYESIADNITQTLTSTVSMRFAISCSSSISRKNDFISLVELGEKFTETDRLEFIVPRKTINSYVASLAHNDDLNRDKTLYFHPGYYTFTKNYPNNTLTVMETILDPWFSSIMADGEAWGINKVDIEDPYDDKTYTRWNWDAKFPPNVFF